jgi:beta-glucosidase/6-phospho-beta-glucosidase/beta-galactosidase
MIKKSNLNEALQSEFIWATGIEDTFVTAAHPITSRHIDEYELTGHYSRWQEDIQLVAQTGVKMCRYGIPWHKIQPEKNRWQWDWTDQVLEAFDKIQVHPIIDLVHYGLPDWIDPAYLHPDFPSYMQEYAVRVAERYKKILWYTPLNEPRIAAWYCGKLGWWPPFKRGWSGFLSILIQISRGVILTMKGLREVNPEIVCVNVDATDVYRADHPALKNEAAIRQLLVFLSLDLITGKMSPEHELMPWLERYGFQEKDLEWFLLNKIDLDLIGINLYPMFTKKVFFKTLRGTRVKMEYAGPELLVDLAEMYWTRYQKPLMVTETASIGSVRRRQAWMKDSIEAVVRIRDNGIPIVGYTWWPLFGLIAWAYRQGHRPLEKYILQMGLWNLDANLNRVKTPLVDSYRNFTSNQIKLRELIHQDV